MENGQVTEEGTYAELLKSSTAFEQLVNAHRSSLNTISSLKYGNQSEMEYTSDDHLELSGLQTVKQNSEQEILTKGSSVQLTEDEETEVGDLGFKPYNNYFRVSKGALLVGVYAGTSIVSCFFSYLRNLLEAHLGLSLRASKEFFTSLMNSVFTAPMSFYDSTPAGRILTRKYYVASARETVRINGTTKAPVMNYASESLLGVGTIHAFAMAGRLFETNLDLIVIDAALLYYTIGTLDWVLLRVEALQNLTIFTSSLLLIFSHRELLLQL